MARRSDGVKSSKNTAPRAVIYARVSSKEQENEGFSIPAHIKLLKDYAASQGIWIVEDRRVCRR